MMMPAEALRADAVMISHEFQPLAAEGATSWITSN